MHTNRRAFLRSPALLLTGVVLVLTICNPRPLVLSAPAQVLHEAHHIQRNCALFVAQRSAAWAAQPAFGSELSGANVRWNHCPGGTKVACVATPTAQGDTVYQGIAWSPGW
jgi:hypothetical protein